MAPLPEVTFSLRLPPSWVEIEVRPTLRDRAIAQAVRARVAQRPELETHRPAIVRYLRELARQSWDTGSRYVGVFIEPAADGFVSGALTVTALPPAPGADPIEAIGDQLRPAADAERTDDWMNTQLVEVGSRPAVRRFGVERVRIDPVAEPLSVVLMQTFVPVPGGVMLITGSSTATDLAEPLLQLFDTVTSTFEVAPGGAR